MSVRISRSLYERLVALARENAEQEVCGLLLGRDDVISDIRVAANVARDRASRFEIDPAVLLRAHREARGGGAPLIGHYHSHPNGKSEPSAIDAAQAGVTGLLWLIIAGGEARIWQEGNAGLHGRFRHRQLVVDPH